MRNAYNIKKTIAILVALLALISCAKDLSAVTSDSSDEARTAKDGWTITGMLPVKKSIFIADGATVTLNEVSINANEAWNDGEGAGTGKLSAAGIGGDETGRIHEGPTPTFRKSSVVSANL